MLVIYLIKKIILIYDKVGPLIFSDPLHQPLNWKNRISNQIFKKLSSVFIF